jgi:hypothetical protein
MNEDAQYLRILSVGHYVLGGLVALFSLFSLFYLYLGVAMMQGTLEPGSSSVPPASMGIFFVAFSLVFLALGLAYAACLVIAGQAIEARRRFVFCLVVAGIACALAPFGTVLGVFTILVLMRPSVKAMFDANGTGAAGPAA